MHQEEIQEGPHDKWLQLLRQDYRPTGGNGVKNIENIKHRNKDIKIKKLSPLSKNIELKHRGRVVRRMTVR